MPVSNHNSKKESANEWRRKRNIRVFNHSSRITTEQKLIYSGNRSLHSKRYEK